MSRILRFYIAKYPSYKYTKFRFDISFTRDAMNFQTLQNINFCEKIAKIRMSPNFGRWYQKILLPNFRYFSSTNSQPGIH